ncbi:FAD-linked oxidase [Kribbella sandramycini]|uniref:FAD-linked oxidase n=1 Tax=Kribbella sandramycini TaxID=60450 RepID=A0A7Y4L2F9_9ACTN|nr:FAD-linked oxidase [Kribbella sandramycini]
MYRRLYLDWGVTLPLGTSPEVGAGGHLLGGGHGALSRQFGLGIDHLYAVEVVTVDASGTARTTVATREPSDPNRELWWAHAGGGGGNFGVVTKFWLRTPGAHGNNPAGLLPRPPGEVLDFLITLPWDTLDDESFTRLVRQHGDWHRAHSAPGDPENRLHSALLLFSRPYGAIAVKGQVAGSERLLTSYVSALLAGVRAKYTLEKQRKPWLKNVLSAGNSEDILGNRFVAKTGYLRERFTDGQIATLWSHLSADDAQGAVWLVSLGGQINATAPDATAVNQRDSVLKAIYQASGSTPADDAAAITWVRNLYADVYRTTGGVPRHDSRNQGCYINYPDPDLRRTNWPALYYGANYPRLQKVKRIWDPTNQFQHSLSIRA